MRTILLLPILLAATSAIARQKPSTSGQAVPTKLRKAFRSPLMTLPLAVASQHD